MTQTCQTRQTRLLLEPTPRVNGHIAPSVNEITLQSLFDFEETPLLRYAFSLVGRRAVAEEIVQEVFLQLHTQWGKVDCPKAWLIRSVRNRAFKHILDDLRYRDISTQTGLNIGNVGYRLHHILKELAARLRKLGFDDKS